MGQFSWIYSDTDKQYPIKITTKLFPYARVTPSKKDPYQGWEE